MNHQEKVVLLVLSIAFLIGAGVNIFKNITIERKARSLPVVLKSAEDTAARRALLDINQATNEQLEALPGIGPVLAQRIIAYREKHGGFKSVNELRNISGIGPKRLAAIRDLVIVDSPQF